MHKRILIECEIQYVGGTARTVPFNAAPSAVVKARDLIQSRMMSIMCGESKPYVFNEVLSAAYMEEQSMSVRGSAGLVSCDVADLHIVRGSSIVTPKPVWDHGWPPCH